MQAPALRFEEEVGEPFVEALDASGLEAVVEAGNAELELVLLDDGVTASQLAVRTEELSSTDRVQSRIASFDAADAGRLRLSLGELDLSFDEQTRYWVGDVPVSREVWVERVRSELSEGSDPMVVAERPASESPQDPEDRSFVATDLTLGGEGPPSLRMKVGPRHIERVSNPSWSEPDAWLKILGHRIRLRMRDGTTQAFCHRHAYPRVVTFEGQVTDVDQEARKLRLEDGTVVRIVGRTDFLRWSGYARSLRAAAEALEAGHAIRARGLAVVEGRESRLLALWIALKVQEAAPPEEPVVVDFEGAVSDARPGDVGTVLELADGTTVNLLAATELVAADENSPSSVEELMEALADGREVVARGEGEVVTDEPLVLDGRRVVLESEAPPAEPQDPFSGVVDFVSDETIFLLDGTTVVVTPETEVVAADELSPASLEELGMMLEDNRRVQVGGEGEADEGGRITAARLVMTAVVGSFDDDVEAVDPDSGGLILVGGSFVRVTSGTVVTPAGDAPADVIGIYEALAAGDRVRARGTGYVRGRFTQEGDEDNYEAISIEVELNP